LDKFNGYFKTWKLLVLATFVFGSYVVNANLYEFLLVSLGIIFMMPVTLVFFGTTRQGLKTFFSLMISYLLLSVLFGAVLEVITEKVLAGGMFKGVAMVAALTSLFLAGVFTKRFFPPATSFLDGYFVSWVRAKQRPDKPRSARHRNTKHLHSV
jgi:hypothetical protein